MYFKFQIVWIMISIWGDWTSDWKLTPQDKRYKRLLDCFSFVSFNCNIAPCCLQPRNWTGDNESYLFSPRSFVFTFFCCGRNCPILAGCLVLLQEPDLFVFNTLEMFLLFPSQLSLKLDSTEVLL